MKKLFDRMGWWMFTVVAIILMLYYMVEQIQLKSKNMKEVNWYNTTNGWALFSIIWVAITGSTLAALGYNNELTWWWLIPGLGLLYIAGVITSWIVYVWIVKPVRWLISKLKTKWIK